MPTRAEFNFSWFYTFSDTPRSLRSEHLLQQERPIATQHSLRNCADPLAALFYTYATPRVETVAEGNRLDDLPVPSMP